MSDRLRDLPAYHVVSDTIEAQRFNQVRLALRRVGNPLRFELGGLRGLDLSLEDEAWVCVDRTLNDMPVLAWLGFATAARAGLHLPVACELRYYHAHADMIRARVLALMDDVLDARLRAAEPAPDPSPF
ncbi:hypothetical protein SVA_3462 [Sulfurifustis variabilis]|uniref:Uncharacterized protein n=1 Tax=Sulfurifustis variabilis TaxID=1675686 RepID=A0A1C7AFC8_9GAMM|nr:hypothetical protein [Sulfurifustis variabilis]BAU49998.1 hypothetical protein SVA_3462 [Sulfurifustis variabilis]